MADRGVEVARILADGESKRGSAGAAVIEIDGSIRYMLMDEIKCQFRERVEEALDEHKPPFVVVDMEANRVHALDRRTLLSVVSSIDSIELGPIPIWDMLLATSATEVKA